MTRSDLQQSGVNWWTFSDVAVILMSCLLFVYTPLRSLTPPSSKDLTAIHLLGVLHPEIGCRRGSAGWMNKSFKLSKCFAVSSPVCVIFAEDVSLLTRFIPSFHYSSMRRSFQCHRLFLFPHTHTVRYALTWTHHIPVPSLQRPRLCDIRWMLPFDVIYSINIIQIHMSSPNPVEFSADAGQDDALLRYYLRHSG